MTSIAARLQRLLLAAAVLAGMAVVPGPAQAAPPRQASRVWNLAMEEDGDFDGWPDRWRRISRPADHIFSHLEFRPTLDTRVLHHGRSSLRMPLYGGNHLLESHIRLPDDPPTADRSARLYLDIDPQVPLVLGARIRTRGLMHGRAYAALVFVDAGGVELPAITTGAVRGDSEWTDVGLRVDHVPDGARRAVIQLWVECPLEDADGAVWFDDVLLREVPRVLLEADPDVFRFEQGSWLTLRTAGVGPGDYPARFSLTDFRGRPIVYRARDAENESLDLAGLVIHVDDAPYEQRIRLEPAEPGYLKAMLSAGAKMEPAAAAMAALDQQAGSDASLGIVIEPDAAPRDVLVHYGGQLGAGMAKLRFNQEPTGDDPDAPGSPDTLLPELRRAGMDFAAILGPAPPSIARAAKDAGFDDMEATPFLFPAELLAPWLNPLLAGHSDSVGWWQVTPDIPPEKVRGDQGVGPARERLPAAIPWARVGLSLPLGTDPPPGADFVSYRVPWSLPPDRIEGLLGGLPEGFEHWATLEMQQGGGVLDDPSTGPLPDLVSKLVYARASDLDRVFVAPLLGRDAGLVLWDGRRGEITPAYVAYRTVASVLQGNDFQYEIPHPRTGRQDGTILVFQGLDTVVVAWGLSEPLFLGRKVANRDVMGRSGLPPEAALGDLPVFYTNVDWPLVATLLDVRFEANPLESQLNPQTRTLTITSHLDGPAVFKGRFRFPEGWEPLAPRPPEFRLALDPGETGAATFTVQLDRRVFLGTFPVKIALDVEGAGRKERFALERDMPVQSNLRMRIVRRQPGLVEVTVRNEEAKPVPLVLHWRLPGGPAREYLLPALGAGDMRRIPIAVPNGSTGELYLGLRDGDKFVNRTWPLER